MADVKCHVETQAEGLAAATAETVLQITAATNQAALVKRWGVSFDGASVTATPVKVELGKNTTAGTSSSKSPVVINGAGETVQTSGADTFTVEPTYTDIYAVHYVHPQGFYEYVFPFPDFLRVDGGARVGIRVTAPATVNVNAFIDFEE